MLWFGRAVLLPAVLTWGAISCGGRDDLSTEQLSAVVEAERPQLTRCYEGVLEKHPHKEEARLQAVIHIAPSGEVSEVELGELEPLPGLSACLREAIGKWRFPKAKEATVTSLPLIFRPEIVQKAPDEASGG